MTVHAWRSSFKRSIERGLWAFAVDSNARARTLYQLFWVNWMRVHNIPLGPSKYVPNRSSIYHRARCDDPISKRIAFLIKHCLFPLSIYRKPTELCRLSCEKWSSGQQDIVKKGVHILYFLTPSVYMFSRTTRPTGLGTGCRILGLSVVMFYVVWAPEIMRPVHTNSAQALTKH